jgi:hypothetical protein
MVVPFGGRTLPGRLYPSRPLTEADYEFLRDTHGRPRELVTELLASAARMIVRRYLFQGTVTTHDDNCVPAGASTRRS